MVNHISRVLLIDEHRLFREGLRALLLKENSPVQVVGEASTAEEAARVLDGLDCNVVSLSLTNTDSSIQAVRQLRSSFPELAILVIASEGISHVLEAVQEGAAGYLPRTATISDFVVGVETVAKGGAYIHPRAASSVLAKIRGTPRAGLEICEREREVLQLLVQGLSNIAIAERLFLSGSTVKSTLRSLFAKLGVSDRTHLVVHAIPRGLVTPRRHHPEAPPACWWD